MSNIPYDNTPTGWVCPKCGSVWSPVMDGCPRCNLSPITLTMEMVLSDPATSTSVDPLANKPEAISDLDYATSIQVQQGRKE